MSGTEGDALPDLCDLCGAVVAGSELYALVPDSSAIHSTNPRFDGKRMIVGCTREHLRELVSQYKARRFVDAELWAGKIGRALDQYPEGLSEQQLAEETGLTPGEIELGVLWQNLGAIRWHERFGKDDGADGEAH